MAKYNAIVLLGYRNSGKDSVCKKLAHKVKGIHNAKFGGFNKLLVSDLLEVPLEWLEDKDWRSQEYIHGITPLELLDALFVYSEASDKFQQKIDDYCLNSIPTDAIPVFTDIRRERELKKVFSKFGYGKTLVFWLDNVDDSDEIGDQDLTELRPEADLFVTNADNNLIADEIIKFAHLESYKIKPTLHLIHESVKNLRAYNSNMHVLPVYEPMKETYEKCVKTAQELGLGQESVFRLFELVYKETPSSQFKLADVVQDCCMLYYPTQHDQFLPALREKANLLLHIQKQQTLSTIVELNFRPEEIKTHD